MSPPPRPPIICYDLTSSSNGSLSRRRIVESTIPTARARRITPAVTYKTYNVPPTIITPLASYQRYTPSSTVTAHEINPPLPTTVSTTTTAGNNGLSSLSGRSSISNATTRHNHMNSHRTAATYSTRPYQTSYNGGCGSTITTTTNNNNNSSGNRPSTISRSSCCSSSNNNNYRKKYDRLAHISLDENCSAFGDERISSNQARHAYGQKLKVEQAQKQRQRHHDLHHRTMIEQLEKIQEQLNALKRNHGAVYNTYGMAHSAAKYIRQQDEEYERLRQKVDQFAETRAKELTRQARLARQYHGLLKDEDQRLDVERRLRDVSNMPPSRKLSHRPMEFSPSPVKSRRPNNSLSSSSNSTPPSTATNSPPNSQGSSSTISISTCSSPVSTTIDRQPQQQQQTPRNITHLVKSPHLPFRTPPSTMPKMKLNPFPQDTLEVTDIEFFSKIEDQTMMEVNKMMNRLQSTMKDFNLNDAHSPSYHLGSSQLDDHLHQYDHYQQQQQQQHLLDHYHHHADEMADCDGLETSVVM